MASETVVVSAEQAGRTLAAVLRGALAGQSWEKVRRLVAARRVLVNGEPCLDAARRLKVGDAVEVRERAVVPAAERSAIVIRHLDDDIVVVEKPSGVATVRHPTERGWSARRKALNPTLEDLMPPLIAKSEGRRRKGPLPRLRVVHRLDKETSGLVVFARTVTAERLLGLQFHRHTVMRRYLAVVPGRLAARTISSRLVRDRGDGRRGSTDVPGAGKKAVTHIEVVEQLPGYTLLGCRLETGRTHQIRIHLAEAGHPVCGEKVYNRPKGAEPVADRSGAPRLALHAAELGFEHPRTGEAVHWEMLLPRDLAEFVERLRSTAPGV